MDDTLNNVLVECVKAAGGSKVVGSAIWPEIGADVAQRKLLNCLGDSNPAHLTPEQGLHIFRLARQRGCHAGMQFMARDLGYAEPVPTEPRDEAAELQRQYIEAARSMAKIAERIESLHRPNLRAA